MNLSNTGFIEQENFLSQLAVHREIFTKFIKAEQDKEARNMMGFMRHGASDQGKLDISRLPNFRYNQLTVTESVSLVLPDLVSLILISIVFYLLAFVLFLRYDVR